MNKLKKWVLKGLVNKYAGAAVSTAVGYAVSFLTTKVADAPAWLVDVILTVINTGAAESGAAQITELNEQSLTLLLTPIFTIAVQAGINAMQSHNVEKIQEANGAIKDGLIGAETLSKTGSD